jgi:trehalose/maltose hydrolase-like predicted phosphorylase
MLAIYYGRMEISGDLQLAQAVNSSLYYIITSIRDDWPWSLSPGGLASNSYNGHSFWDGETWMYPSLLMLHPDLAQSMIEYRYNHMQGAEIKASSYNKGYQGTMYPWESAFTGQEVCPTTAPTGQLEQRIRYD